MVPVLAALILVGCGQAKGEVYDKYRPLSPSYGSFEKSVRSPSAEFELKVWPRGKSWEPLGSYRMLRKGKALWRADLPFFLYDAVVGDSGCVLGYAYSQAFGYEGGGRPNLMTVWHIDARGKATRVEEITREWMGMHRPSRPYGGYLVLHEPQDRVVIPVTGGVSRDPRRTLYQVSTGEKDRELNVEVDLQPAHAKELVLLRSVDPTALTLMGWKTEGSGLFVGLYDLDGHRVWAKDMPGGLTWFHSSKEDVLFHLIFSTGLMQSRESPMVEDPSLACDKPASFALHVGNERVEFEVSQTQGGWTVRESRAAFREDR